MAHLSYNRRPSAPLLTDERNGSAYQHHQNPQPQLSTGSASGSGFPSTLYGTASGPSSAWTGGTRQDIGNYSNASNSGHYTAMDYTGGTSSSPITQSPVAPDLDAFQGQPALVAPPVLPHGSTYHAQASTPTSYQFPTSGSSQHAAGDRSGGPPTSGRPGSRFPSSGLGMPPYTQSDLRPRADQQSVMSGSTLVGYTPANAADAVFRETWMRRLRSLMYLKQTLANASQTSMPPARSNDPSGYAQPWLDTARFSRRDMDIHDDPERVRKRSARKFMLGCSLAPTLDIPSGPECARTVLAVFTEVEAMPDGGEKEKAKMRNFFKSSLRNLKRAGNDGLVNSLDSVGIGGPPSTLVTASGVELIGAHVPFVLDFFQVIQTLCDVLVEIYCKLSLAMQGNNGGMNGGGGRDDGLGGMSDASSTNTAMLDNMHKIDTRVKKLFAQLYRELDSVARRVVREELASIDPLMARELGVAEENAAASANPAPSRAGVPPLAAHFGDVSL